MTNHLVGIFYNLDLRNKHFGFTNAQPLIFAGNLTIEADNDSAACEKAFSWAQRADGLNATEGVSTLVPVDGQSSPVWIERLTGDGWLDERKAPSLSVGDVVLINRRFQVKTDNWFVVASFGFNKIDTPSNIQWDGSVRAAIDDAINTANRSQS